MSSGMRQFFIQNVRTALSSNRNNMPWSAGMLSRNIRPRSRAGSVSAISTSKRCPFSSTLGPVARAEQAARLAANAAPSRCAKPLRMSGETVGAIECVDQACQRGEILRVHVIELDAEVFVVGPDQQAVG